MFLLKLSVIQYTNNLNFLLFVISSTIKNMISNENQVAKYVEVSSKLYYEDKQNNKKLNLVIQYNSILKYWFYVINIRILWENSQKWGWGFAH